MLALFPIGKARRIRIERIKARGGSSQSAGSKIWRPLVQSLCFATYVDLPLSPERRLHSSVIFASADKNAFNSAVFLEGLLPEICGASCIVSFVMKLAGSTLESSEA